jgi:nucleotide-binding universal stress UspA family protein
MNLRRKKFQGGFKMIRRILCPTDLTKNSRSSIAYALQLAKENGAQLIVFHATSFPSLTQYPGDLEPYFQWEQLASKFKMEQIFIDAERRVRNFVATRFGTESNGVVWKPRVALGKVAEEIVAAALQEEVDLVVMTGCKRGMLARVFTRSISEVVSKSSPCPVLLIDATQPIRSIRGRRAPVLHEIVQSP